MLGLIMAIIDTTIVNVAINTIGGNLGATVNEVAWVATGYILANVVVMPLNGWLTALLGRKTFYAISLAVFTIASFFCGTARSIWVLVFYRIVQGLGGGALQPTAQAIMFETFPPERRGAAMAIFGMGAMVGPAIGPALGGWIVDNANWPLIFYINIPIGIAAFLMTLAFIPNPKYIAKPKGGIDWIGLGLLTAGLLDPAVRTRARRTRRLVLVAHDRRSVRWSPSSRWSRSSSSRCATATRSSI